jgi:hypothetical protein
MRKTNIFLIALIFIVVSCVAAGVPAAAQKNRARRRAAGQRVDRQERYTLSQLQQEMERREAAGEPTQVMPSISAAGAANKSVTSDDPSLRGLAELRSPSTLSGWTNAQLLRGVFFEIQSVFGRDSRTDAENVRRSLANRNSPQNVARFGFRVDETAVMNNMKSVMALMHQERLQDLRNGRTRIVPEATYKAKKNLCNADIGRRFHDQPVAAHCTGFLVAPNIVATASHCLRAVPLSETRFVFGYTDNALTVNNSEVYRGERVIRAVPALDSPLGDRNPDWALIELVVAVPSDAHPPVKIRARGSITWGEELYAVGHPDGLPLKYIDGAFVKSNPAGPYFVSNLDTFHGNSGSPVFNARTGLLEGILVRGGADYDRRGEGEQACNIAKVCDMNRLCEIDIGGGSDCCRGEECTRVSEFIREIPADLPAPNP